ncbi:MAG: histidine kinase [Treponema sp.]|jgi:two-component system sensor histidine kinase YesM|nr:histidine kinase [Treponema sp.]
MHFRTRLVFTYSLLVSALITILAFAFEIYNLRHLETRSLQNLDILCKNMSRQLDEIVRPMVFITEFLLSDSNTLSAITALARVERNTANSSYIRQAKQNLRVSLSTYCTNSNFYRVSFFSEKGDILSNNLQVPTTADGEADPGIVPLIPDADEYMGKPVLVPAYIDPWNKRYPVQVFGILRLIMGNNTASYIEVQKTAASLEEIYNLNNTGSFLLAVIKGNGDIFYSQFDEKDNAALGELRRSLTHNGSISRFGGRLAASWYSPYTDTHTVVIQSRTGMREAVGDTTRMTIIMALCICMVSVAVITLLSRRITVPIGQLIQRIENTNLDNIEHDVLMDFRDDEFARFCQSYNALLKRLNTARLKEEQLGLLHLQAEFDALQAQVNPHFLYNVLNVISHRGVQNGDEVICEICEKLASMLRYSAGVSKRLVPVSEDVEYLKNYLYLLKTRYRDKLIYSLEIEDEVLRQMIPKIVLQQLVENSISHGFTGNSGIMRIDVKGYTEGRYWYVEISDNGCGFREEEKAKLESGMEKMVGALNEGKLNLDIGGMGFLNIYARFLILFGNDVIFRISDTADGAKVTIGSLMRKEE